MELKSNADPRIAALPDIHGHAKGEHKPFAEERPIPYTARMLFLWFFHACRRNSPRFVMVADHMNYLTFEDPAAVNLVRRALKLAQAGDLYGAAETAGVELGHAAVVSEGLRRGMRYSIGAEIDNDPRCRPDAQNIVDAMKPDGMIRSVHFLPITHPTHGENWMWPFDNPEFKDLYDVVGSDNVWEIYMATLLDAIDKLPGHIVGHFYVPAKFGHWPADDVLEGYEDRFLAACAERGMAIEVNSRYFYKYFLDDDTQRAKYRAAHLRLLRKAKERGVMVAVGSDAHSPKDQGGAFATVLALLDEADINEIAFPLGGRLARVALRATEEILREHTAALAAPAERVAARAAAAMHAPTADDADSDDDDDATVDDRAPKPELIEVVMAVAAPIEVATVVSQPASVSAETNATIASAATKKRAPKKVAAIVEVAEVAEHAIDTVVAMPHAPEATPPSDLPKPTHEVVATATPVAATATPVVATATPVVAPATKPKARPAPVKVAVAPMPAATPEPIGVPAKPLAEKPELEKPDVEKPIAKKAAEAKPVATKVVPENAIVAKTAAVKVISVKAAPAKTASVKAASVKAAPAKAAPAKAAPVKAAPVKATATKSAPKSAAPKAKARTAVAKPTPKSAKAKTPVAKTKVAVKPSKAAPKKAVAKKPTRSAAPAKKTSGKPVAKKTPAKPARAAAKRAPIAKTSAKPVARPAKTKAKPKVKAPEKKAAAKKPAVTKSSRARR